MKLTERVQVRITPQMFKELGRLASTRRLRGGKEAEIIREAVAQYIEKHTANSKPVAR